MPLEPEDKRAVAFIDGQNLHKAVKEAFGYSYPNYDVLALSQAICDLKSWRLCQVRFYTGVPPKNEDHRWHHFWSQKFLTMSRQKVKVFHRDLRYHTRTVLDQQGNPTRARVPQEKGIDVRIALDLVKLAHRKDYDVALIFSQDQDLFEATEEVKKIAKEQGRWVKLASAFPQGTSNHRGINKTDWIAFGHDLYDNCIDTRDYRLRT